MGIGLEEGAHRGCLLQLSPGGGASLWASDWVVGLGNRYALRQPWFSRRIFA